MQTCSSFLPRPAPPAFCVRAALRLCPSFSSCARNREGCTRCLPLSEQSCARGLFVTLCFFRRAWRRSNTLPAAFFFFFIFIFSLRDGGLVWVQGRRPITWLRFCPCRLCRGRDVRAAHGAVQDGTDIPDRGRGFFLFFLLVFQFLDIAYASSSGRFICLIVISFRCSRVVAVSSRSGPQGCRLFTQLRSSSGRFSESCRLNCSRGHTSWL